MGNFRKLSGNFHQNFRKLSGNFPETFRKFSSLVIAQVAVDRCISRQNDCDDRCTAVDVFDVPARN